MVSQDRRGKGNALACGFAVASGDIIVMLDADGSTDPAEIPAVRVASCSTGADFAKGSRFTSGGGTATTSRVIRAVGNRVLGATVNVLYRTQLHRPLLRLQRVLAPLPALHGRRRPATDSRSRR